MEIPRADRRAAGRALWIAAAATAVITAASIALLDQPIARGLARYEPLAVWDRGIDALEWTLGLPLFKWTAGIVLVIGMVVTASVARWRHYAPTWMLIAATHVVSRMVTLELKLATGRLRPSQWLERGGETFWRDDGVSFPSGHVVLFASIVIPLVVVVPRARPLLAVVAFVMAARLAVSAHFLSDVVGAITVTAVVTGLAALVIRPVTRRAS